jgi:hypothetical protein
MLQSPAFRQREFWQSPGRNRSSPKPVLVLLPICFGEYRRPQIIGIPL